MRTEACCNYFCNRYQFVVFRGSESMQRKIRVGVPQGSILGPLFFLIYINDLPEVTKLFVKLYADDTFLCAQNNDPLLLETEVNCELRKVYDWMCSNRLTLNIESKCMIITKRQNTLPIELKINNVTLEQCTSYKYLGVIFDKDLNWKPHIEYICGKITRSVGGLASLRHRTSLSVLREVFFALIHSYVRLKKIYKAHLLGINKRIKNCNT